MASPQTSGAEIKLTAKATGEGTLQYKFSVENEEGIVAVLRDYGTGNAYIWTVKATGNKTLYVDVKSDNGETARESIPYTIE